MLIAWTETYPPDRHLSSCRAAKMRRPYATTELDGVAVVMVVYVAGRVVGYDGLAPTAIVPAALRRGIRAGQPRNLAPRRRRLIPAPTISDLA